MSEAQKALFMYAEVYFVAVLMLQSRLPVWSLGSHAAADLFKTSHLPSSYKKSAQLYTPLLVAVIFQFAFHVSQVITIPGKKESQSLASRCELILYHESCALRPRAKVFGLNKK